MRILVVGGGGREHALAWKCAQQADVEKVYVAPGNYGTLHEQKCVNINIDPNNHGGLREFAIDNFVDLTIVGPEQPLVDGIGNVFQDAGLKIFGPNRIAAEFEADKAFTRKFCLRHNIPVPNGIEAVNYHEAVQIIKQNMKDSEWIVVKATGLAAGKGVCVTDDIDEAIHHAAYTFSGNFGNSKSVIIEERLEGFEVSYMGVTDGNIFRPFPSSQDHKTIRADGGPMTGGMGAFSPSNKVNGALATRIEEEIINPTLRGMKAEHINYTGFLYAGVMVDSEGNPKLLEYNCRLGDPETQVLMMRMASSLPTLCFDVLNGQLETADMSWSHQPVVGVVMAAPGYPGAYEKDAVIFGDTLREYDGTKVFHAGTRPQESCSDAPPVTSGGRVLCVCATSDDGLESAKYRAYSRVLSIGWNGVQYRVDIGNTTVAQST